MAAGKKVAEFVGEENGEESDCEGQSGQKQGGMVVGDRKELKQRIEGRGLVVSIRRGKMSARNQRSDQCKQK